MNLANMLTLLRIILSPVFLIIFFLPKEHSIWAIPVLWAVFIISEITDYFDGLAARKLNLTSDFGKLFDPFADTLVQITYFLCFLISGIWPCGILPLILLLLVVYREFGILFLRNLMLKKGVTLGARMLGKIKTVFYIIAVGFALLAVSIDRFSILESFLLYFRIGALVIFAVSVIFSVISFIDYILIYQKTEKVND
ncbi:MAG: CDP-diacylglycerol--glycerol-3-phosphate 3-phosphatidyltransferase [Treponema sp.]|nr:CDP-diacylglycerol--glycerol-3-phosphate 3-phosphatidyltransferase [Treponema sp.]